jgi:DNA-binding CsgD family transcriptional regulator
LWRLTKSTLEYTSGIPYKQVLLYFTGIDQTPDQAFMNFDAIIKFTPQEIKIINLICKQYSAIDIAAIMHLKPRTIENYRRRIQKKIGARNEVGIALYALLTGLISQTKSPPGKISSSQLY